MISQESLLPQLHLLKANNEIYCDANLKLMSELKVANNRLKCLINGDETTNNLLGIRKPSHDMCDLGSFETRLRSACTNIEAVEKSLPMTSMVKCSLKKISIPT